MRIGVVTRGRLRSVVTARVVSAEHRGIGSERGRARPSATQARLSFAGGWCAPFEVAFQHSTRRLHGLEAPMHSVALSDDGLEVLLRASNA